MALSEPQWMGRARADASIQDRRLSRKHAYAISSDIDSYSQTRRHHGHNGSASQTPPTQQTRKGKSRRSHKRSKSNIYTRKSNNHNTSSYNKWFNKVASNDICFIFNLYKSVPIHVQHGIFCIFSPL